MSKDRPWTVLPHAPLEKLEPNLWTADASSPIAIRRRATIVRLSSGRLVMMNAVPLDDAAQKELEAWGEPAFLVAPNGFHRLDLAAYKRRYPKIAVLCPPDQKRRIEAVVPTDGDFDLLPAGEGLRRIELAGTKVGEPAFAVDSDGRTSVLLPGDALFNHPHAGGFMGFMMKLLGSTGGPRVTAIARTFIMKDAAALAGSFRAMAALPGLARVIVCHGGVIDRDPAGVLRGVADKLEGKAPSWPPIQA